MKANHTPNPNDARNLRKQSGSRTIRRQGTKNSIRNRNLNTKKKK